MKASEVKVGEIYDVRQGAEWTAGKVMRVRGKGRKQRFKVRLIAAGEMVQVQPASLRLVPQQPAYMGQTLPAVELANTKPDAERLACFLYGWLLARDEGQLPPPADIEEAILQFENRNS